MEARQSTFSDLLDISSDGTLTVQDGVHHLKNLLHMSPNEIMQAFKDSQIKEFEAIIDSEDFQWQEILGNQFGKMDSVSLLQQEQIRELFLELHNHVMSHPVWLHPFFIRVFKGEFTAEQARLFAVQYFNQIKNTRQCVALSLGRFSGLVPRVHKGYSDRISELTQIALSQLVADEYGVSTHTIEEYPTLKGIFDSTTHIVMYRQLFEGIGVPFENQDVPLIHGVADNVIIQRILAANDTFTLLESLASVGLGMEWGVPEFFTLILGGLIRFAYQSNTPLTRHHLSVFIAHVQYDVLHAISVMYVTAFYIQNQNDIESIKNATNMLMAGRFGMMTDLYENVFQEKTASIHEISLDPRYHIKDYRIKDELLMERKKAAPETVQNLESYRNLQDTPFVFADTAQ